MSSENTYIVLSLCALTLMSIVPALLLVKKGAIFELRAGKFNTAMLLFLMMGVGALTGEVFIHMIPELAEDDHFTLWHGTFFSVVFLISEAIRRSGLHAHELPHEVTEIEVKPEGLWKTIKPLMQLIIANAVHNFIDGLVLAVAWHESASLGLSTLLAVLIHEIPHELADMSAYLTRLWRQPSYAVFINVGVEMFVWLGMGIGILLGDVAPGLRSYIMTFAAANFLFVGAVVFWDFKLKRVEADATLKTFKFELLCFVSMMVGVLVMLLIKVFMD